MKSIFLILNVLHLVFGYSKDYLDDYFAQERDEIETEMTYKIIQGESESQDEKITIQVYYESLCPYSKHFFINEFFPTYMVFGEYLDVHLNPYGNAETIESDGKIEFHCQHGPEECYGNKLHACAMEHLEHVSSLYFITCLMTFDSDDDYADQCAEIMSLNIKSTKQCAQGDKGKELLKNYGVESKEVGFKGVPYVLINGEALQWDGYNFMENICSAFDEPPMECNYTMP